MLNSLSKTTIFADRPRLIFTEISLQGLGKRVTYNVRAVP